ncbi:FAD-binding oxidoreductase, partial [Microvirga sp. 3-52]|nr:FAD-binding oxidoreductase [Microvirga sp. 3-52]
MISETIKSQFEEFVGKENVEDDQATLLAYSYDATPGFQAMPHCIISPRNAHEVAAVVKLCNE